MFCWCFAILWCKWACKCHASKEITTCASWSAAVSRSKSLQASRTRFISRLEAQVEQFRGLFNKVSTNTISVSINQSQSLSQSQSQVFSPGFKRSTNRNCNDDILSESVCCLRSDPIKHNHTVTDWSPLWDSHMLPSYLRSSLASSVYQNGNANLQDQSTFATS